MVIGFRLYIYHSQNGGLTWRPSGSYKMSSGGVQGPFFQTENRGWLWVSAQNGRSGGYLMRTTDGGEKWHALYRTTDWSGRLQLDFVSTSVGWALCDQGPHKGLYRTIDGGVSWRKIGRLGAADRG